jgi:hypothetical protein
MYGFERGGWVCGVRYSFLLSALQNLTSPLFFLWENIARYIRIVLSTLLGTYFATFDQSTGHASPISANLSRLPLIIGTQQRKLWVSLSFTRETHTIPLHLHTYISTHLPTSRPPSPPSDQPTTQPAICPRLINAHLALPPLSPSSPNLNCLIHDSSPVHYATHFHTLPYLSVLNAKSNKLVRNLLRTIITHYR